MSTQQTIQQLIHLSSVHKEWVVPLSQALLTVDSTYLNSLSGDDSWLPGHNNILAAFRRDLTNCDYILFGESPYPRAESANGIAFYDAAVSDLWSDRGLSKAVNRATSLRNIMKAALLAQGLIESDLDGKIPQSSIAAIDKQSLVQDIHQLFSALQKNGFLMFNATPVLHPQRKPVSEAKFWSGFVNQLLIEIKLRKKQLPTLVLWGKIATQIDNMPGAVDYPKISSEHPYNISFIHNKAMLSLFKELKLLTK